MMKSMAIVGLIAGALLGQATPAVEITVLSAGAVEAGLEPASLAFEKRTGHAVKHFVCSGAADSRANHRGRDVGRRHRSARRP